MKSLSKVPDPEYQSFSVAVLIQLKYGLLSSINLLKCKIIPITPNKEIVLIRLLLFFTIYKKYNCKDNGKIVWSSVNNIRNN